MSFTWNQSEGWICLFFNDHNIIWVEVDEHFRHRELATTKLQNYFWLWFQFFFSSKHDYLSSKEATRKSISIIRIRNKYHKNHNNDNSFSACTLISLFKFNTQSVFHSAFSPGSLNPYAEGDLTALSSLWPCWHASALLQMRWTWSISINFTF